MILELSLFSICHCIEFIKTYNTLTYFLQFLSLVVGMLLVVGVANFWMLLLLIPLVVVFVFTRRYYTATSRQVKHFEVTGE